MANEAVCIETPTKFRRCVIGDAVDAPIGTLMELEDHNTCSLTDADTNPFAGIVWVAKEANDGVTEIVLAIDGVWDVKVTAAAVAFGQLINVGGANVGVLADEAGLVAGSFIGKAMEAGNDSYVRCELGSMI